NLDVHKATVLMSEENYEKSLTEMSKRIKETEAENLRSGRKRQRDLSQFRRALQDLTRQVEELDRLKTEYYRQTLETEQNNHSFILSKVSTVIRAEVDIYERIYNKGISDPILEGMINQGTDPFCPYPTADQSSEIFSVLPPVPIINPIPEPNSVATSSTIDLSNEDMYSPNGVKIRSPLSTITDDVDEERGFIIKPTISRRNTRDNSRNIHQYHDEEYDQFTSEHSDPLKFHRPNNGTLSSQLSLLVGSDTPSIGRDFHPSINPGFHISDDAELLHDKEFAYGVEDSGFEGSLASNSTDYGKMNETKDSVFLKVRETTVSDPPL
ncbi:11594_t:CDS:2, partial [Acaulospora morrowiae]